MIARSTREATGKLKIIKRCLKYCHLFEFFSLNNKAVFYAAFAGENFKEII